MQQRVVTGGFIVRNGTFLLVKRADNDNFLPGVWEIPGGKLEYGEEPEAGAKREVLEESGLIVELDSPLSVWSYSNPGITQYVQVDFLFHPVDNSEVKLSEEHSDFAWITFEELDNYEISPLMKEELLKIRSHPLVSF